jgi:RimJ/RimL family protein N-acetyltransferase
MTDLSFRLVRLPEDGADVVDFLCASPWLFHATAHHSPASAANVTVHADDVQSFWVVEDGVRMGLIRLLDLADVEDGSPLFDVRIDAGHRGRGLGTRAVAWLTEYVFTEFPATHRIEATTRHDNLAMQVVLERCGYRCEGQLVEAWRSEDGTRHDTLIYAILRRERDGRS